MNDPYGSHAQALITIASGIKTVLELGSGVYSTPLFLKDFPDLEKLVSIEHNATWADKVKALCNDDRLEMIVVPEPIEGYLQTLNLDDFDFIFVDNSDCWENRVKTIEYVAKNVGRSLVGLHDFEHPPYREAAKGLNIVSVDTRQVPHTAFVRR
jgi:hypothetical protein